MRSANNTKIAAILAAGLLPLVSAPTAGRSGTVADNRGNASGTEGRSRLSLSYATVHAGASRPFAVLHATDTHLAWAYDDEGEKKLSLRNTRMKAFGGRQLEAIRHTLAWARDNADLVVHTGDLIDFQSRANFDAVREIFADAPDLFACMGNHEFSRDLWLGDPKNHFTEAWKDCSREALGAVYPFDISFQSRIVNGVNFVAIDNVFGVVTAAQVERFRAEALRGLPIILCVHVPFYTDELWRATRAFRARPGTRFADAAVPAPAGERMAQERHSVTRDFIAYLRTVPLLKAILAGHVHFTAEERFSPTAVQYVTGPNFRFCARMLLVLP